MIIVVEVEPREIDCELVEVFLHIEGFSVYGIRNWHTGIEGGPEKGEHNSRVSWSNKHHKSKYFSLTC